MCAPHGFAALAQHNELARWQREHAGQMGSHDLPCPVLGPKCKLGDAWTRPALGKSSLHAPQQRPHFRRRYSDIAPPQQTTLAARASTAANVSELTGSTYWVDYRDTFRCYVDCIRHGGTQVLRRSVDTWTIYTTVRRPANRSLNCLCPIPHMRTSQTLHPIDVSQLLNEGSLPQERLSDNQLIGTIFCSPQSTIHRWTFSLSGIRPSRWRDAAMINHLLSTH